jgi:hypothetical protein
VAIDNASPTGVDAFGYQATPVAQVAPAAFETLLSGPGGSSYLGIYTHPDGREEMVMTVDGNENQIHAQLLRHGMLSWATRGVHLGYQRNYFEMHVDDVFLSNDRWDTTLDRTLVDAPADEIDELTCVPPPAPVGSTAPVCRPIRMTAADVTRLVQWQAASGMKLDMVFNGGGADEFRADNGADPFADAILANKAAFRWINHTFTHPNLDNVTLGELTTEIGRNSAWGASHGLPMDPAELVTGQHSGLHNGFMPAALTGQGVRWVAADNSREPTPYTIGSATTVPRYPSNIYYNVETQAEQLDEYNHIYLAPPAGRCVASATNTCRTAPATWAEYVASEATIMFRHLMGNDPRPHYAHQSNITGEGVLYTVLDEVLRRYHAAFSVPLVQLTQSEIGAAMRRQATWAQDVAAGRVTAFLRDGQVTVTSTVATQAPITGTPAGALYGGERSGWFAVSPGQPITQAAPGAAPVARRGAAATLGAPTPRQRTTPRATRRVALRLTRLRMSPRRFAVAHNRRAVRRRRGHRPDGTAITFLLSRPATVNLTVQRIRGTRAVPVATLVRRGIAGENIVRFSGRIGRRVLRPGRYRMRVSARAPAQRTRARTITFTITRG